MTAVCDSLTDIKQADLGDRVCRVNFTPAFYNTELAKPVVRLDELKMTVVERRLRTTIHSVSSIGRWDQKDAAKWLAGIENDKSLRSSEMMTLWNTT
ncbi:hypothetical protein [Candidatus Methanomassiliicoccus intestinalis]|uniref:hypothetical protein n=1 Tax=Candidatus Methanomassiliicoccus intestinalis TaxID=1406512 RepID=UPI0037DCC735